jgi:DNA-binding transcriptional ArsR family regulator
MKRAARRALPATATLAQVKALADPLRFRVFENLLGQPRTARQMAEHLGTHPTRLYHHFRVLETAGLIRPAGTRQKRGTTEKYFQAVGDRIETGALSAAVSTALLEGVLGSTLADIRQARRPAAGGRRATMYVKRYRIRATREQAAWIQARLNALAEWCETVSGPADATEFGVTLAFYETPDTRKRGARR